MATYLQVLNDNGIVQITDTYKNIQFLRKGTVVSDGSVTIGIDEVLAFRSDSGYWSTLCDHSVHVNTGYVSFDGSTKKYSFVGTGTIHYYVFGYTNTPAGKCFEARNARGEIIFSDATQSLKVLAQVAGNDMELNPAGIHSTHERIVVTGYFSPGQQCAIIPSSLSVIQGMAGVQRYMENASFLWSDTTFVCVYKSMYVDPTKVSPYGIYPHALFGRSWLAFTVIDVTGL